MAIKVLNILEDARVGGIVNRVIDVTNEMSSTNVETVVLFPEKDSKNFENKLSENGITFYKKPIYRLTYDPNVLLRYISNFFHEIIGIKKIIHEENIDIVHCNGAWQFKGIIAAYFSNAKSVWHLNDTYQPFPILILFKILSFLCDAYIVASERTKQYYSRIKNLEKKPIATIQAPIEFKKLAQNDRKSDLLERFSGVKVITVCHINPNKDIKTLVRTVNQVNNKTDLEINFFVAGKVLDSQTKYFKSIKSLIHRCNIKNIHFLGYQDNIKNILNSSDIYLCTSNNEASPISVWEGMAAGIPVVSTNVGDVKTVFEKHECGIVTEVNDPEELSNGILRIVKDKLLNNKLSKNAQIIAKKLFDIKSVAQQYKDFYNRIG